MVFNYGFPMLYRLYHHFPIIFLLESSEISPFPQLFVAPKSGSRHPHRLHPERGPVGRRQDAFGAAHWGAGGAAGAWEFGWESVGNP